MDNQAIWHDGERFLQAAIGAEERMAEVGQRVIRSYMPDQHREFYAQLPFIVLGSVDKTGAPWATAIEGQPGFISSPAPSVLDIAISLAPSDPASRGIVCGSSVGLLGIEMHTRRRNRMNGVITKTGGQLRVNCDQSFGNCPRYIQMRDYFFSRPPGDSSSGRMEEMASLDTVAVDTIQEADTLFVASYAAVGDRKQVDVSHRGGRQGFVRVNTDRSLTIPDFNGNRFFATLGNIKLNGKAGLLFIDFGTGSMLQMTGEAELVLSSSEITAFQGAERLWNFRPEQIVRRTEALALRWSSRPDGYSPHSLMTGDWSSVSNVGAHRTDQLST